MFNFTDITTADLANLAEDLNKSLRGDRGEVTLTTLGLIASARNAAVAEIQERMAEVIKPMTSEKPEPVKLPSLGTAQAQWFTDIAQDSGNWGGNPWVDGQGNIGRVPKPHLENMEKKGLLVVHRNEEGVSVTITRLGGDKAAEMGITNCVWSNHIA